MKTMLSRYFELVELLRDSLSTLTRWMEPIVAMWLCGYVAMWLCGYVAFQ